MFECIHEGEELRVKEGENNQSPKGIDVCILTASALHHISHLSNRRWSSHSSPLQIHDLNQVHVASLLLLQGEGAFSCCYLSICHFHLIKNNTAYRYLKLERCFLTLPLIAFCD